MPKNKKPFIGDKKKAVSFRLVHRSQRDPLVGTDASEHVLAPLDGPLDVDPSERREAQQKFGIYYDDDYDYLQHLRDVDEVVTWGEPIEQRYRVEKGRAVDAGVDLPTTSATDVAKKLNRLQIPSSVLETEGVELRTGLLNQAAPLPGPHPELDADVLAALDDDFDFDNPENQLEDDFMLKANAIVEDTGEEGGSDSEDDGSAERDFGSDFGEGEDDLGDFPEEETRTHFTNYSMTSSVIRRSEGLQRIDDMFEKAYEKYDEEEIGGLDLDAMEDEGAGLGGTIEPDSDRILALAEEFRAQKEAESNLAKTAFETKEKSLVRLAEEEEEESVREKRVWVEEERRSKSEWDCESILSTYSTAYNHPTLIREPPKKKRLVLNSAGLPEGVLKGSGGLTAKALRALDQGVIGMDVDERGSMRSSRRSTASTFRPKGETPEERRLRKKEVKAERKVRREEKKANKLAFKDEKKRVNAAALNSKRLEGMKLA